jgi:hypothetical protein
MMRGKIVSQVVAVIGILALSVALAQAGSGSGTIAFSAFFECQGINGAANLNQAITIGDPFVFSAFPIQSAIVGKAALACKQVQVRDATGQVPTAPPSGDVLKCYSIAVQGPAETPQFFNFTDAFGSETNVRVQGSRYLCGTATESQ